MLGGGAHVLPGTALPLTPTPPAPADLPQVEVTKAYLAKQADEITLQQADVVLVLEQEDGEWNGAGGEAPGDSPPAPSGPRAHPCGRCTLTLAPWTQFLPLLTVLQGPLGTLPQGVLKCPRVTGSESGPLSLCVVSGRRVTVLLRGPLHTPARGMRRHPGRAADGGPGARVTRNRAPLAAAGGDPL